MIHENNNISNPEGDDNIHDGTDSDGIRELTNSAPYWIIFVFILTYGFSLFYAIHYFGYPGNGNDQVSEYTNKVAAAETAGKGMKDPSTEGAIMSKAEISDEGARLFTQKGCIACHGMKGEGNNIGPNLTDNYWINGCSEQSLIAIITEGKPEKGMTPYKTMMTPKQIKIAALYIRQEMSGSNPENAKAPQGIECKP